MALDESQVEQLTKLLQRMEPGELPLSVFIEFARLYVTSILELVPLRLHEGNVQVLLLEREASDPTWAGQLHTPGTVVRPKDVEAGLKGVFERLIAAELPGVSLSQPAYVTTVVNAVKRGTECANVFYAEVLDDGGAGNWYDVEQLPEKIVDTQIEFIREAATKFEQKHE